MGKLVLYSPKINDIILITRIDYTGDALIIGSEDGFYFDELSFTLYELTCALRDGWIYIGEL